MTRMGDASGAAEDAHKLVSSIAELVASVSAVDAVLVAIALAVLLMLRAGVRAAASVGPVEVETLTPMQPQKRT